jgi:hypothetical protein
MQYKLKKIYPGSPELGTIVENRHGAIYCVKTTFIWSSSDVDYFDKMVTNQPEFWEKVVKKDYEILEFTSKNSGCVAIKNKKGTYDSENFANMEEFRLLADDKSLITKVKRLADNVRFKIGDICKPKNYTGNAYPITKIEIIRDNILRINSRNWYLDINSLEHYAKPVLFTTEDGVDIVEGNAYYSILENYQIMPNTCNKHGISLNRKEVKYFFFREKAEAYITFNKPCLALIDVLSAIGKIDSGQLKNLYILTNKLTETVKSKL